MTSTATRGATPRQAIKASGAPSKAPFIAAVILIAGMLPIVGSKLGLINNFYLMQLSLMIVYSIAVLGLNLLTGFSGQISLGHGAFFAVGAYTAAILIDHSDWPYMATLTVA